MQRPGRYQPVLARRVGWAAACAAVALPIAIWWGAVWAESLGAGLAGFLGLELAYGALAWRMLRPATTVDLDALTVRRFLWKRHITGVSSWGRGPREGWVSVTTNTGDVVVFTEPDEARPLFDDLARALPYVLQGHSALDGVEVRRTGVRGLRGASGPIALGWLTLGWSVGAFLVVLSGSWDDTAQTLKVATLFATFVCVVATVLHLPLALLTVLGRTPRGTQRVTVHGTRLEAHAHRGVKRLDLRGEVHTALSHDGDGARLEVRTAEGELVIRGTTVALSAVQRAIQAIRPGEGTADDVPSSLRQVRAAHESP